MTSRGDMGDEAEVRGVVSLNIDDAKAQLDALSAYAESQDIHGKLEDAISKSVDTRGGGKAADIFGFGKAFKDNQTAMSNLAGWTKGMRKEFAETGAVGMAMGNAMTDAIKQADDASKTYVDSLTAIQTTFGKISKVTGIAGGAIVAGLMGLVYGASADEDALAKLGQAMKATGEWSQTAQDNFEAQALALLRLSGIDKTATISAMGMAKAYGLTNDQVTALLPHLADLQSGPLGIPMATSFKLANNALAGNTAMLSRYGIHVEKAKDGTVSFENVLKAFSSSSGQAEAAGDRLSGQIKTLQGTTRELASSFGAQLIPEAQKVVSWAQKLVDEFDKMTPAQKKASLVAAEWAAGILLGTSALTGMIAKLAGLLKSIQILQASPAVAWFMTFLAGVGGAITGGLAITAVAATSAYKTAMNPNALDEAEMKWKMFGGKVEGNVLGGRGSGQYLDTVAGRQLYAAQQEEGGYVGYKPPPKSPIVTLSEEATTATTDLTAKIFKLANTGLANSLEVLRLEAIKLREIQGIDKALVDKWEAGQKALIIKEATQGYKDRLYAATHTPEQTALYDLRKSIDDMVEAGSMSKGQGNELYNLEAAKKKVSATEFKPVTVEGTNVSPLMGFIASLQGGKEKKQTLLVDVKIDGKTIKVDTNSALSRENIDKIGRAVITQMMNNKSWSFAGG